MSTTAKPVHERVIDLYEVQDGAFLIEGSLHVGEVTRQVSEFLNHTLGEAGWSDLRIFGLSRWFGRWEETERGDDRWVSDAEGDPWTYVLTEYEMS